MRNVLVVVMVLVAACGGSKGAGKKVVEPAPPPPPVAEPAPPPPPPLSPEERLAVHGTCHADFVAEVPAVFARCFTGASEQELVDSGQPPAVGPEAIAAQMAPLWAGFTLEGEIRMNLVGGDSSLTIALLRGTHDGPYNGLAPTGKVFGVFVAEVHDLDDQGRHGAVRNYVDLGAMMAQLGAGPKGAKVRAPYTATGKPGPTVVATGAELEATNVALIQAGFDRFNQQDWKGFTALYARDAAIYEQVAPADTEGARAIGKFFAEVGKAFPDAREKVTSAWAAGDFVVAETTFTGTNNGPWPRLGLKKGTTKPVTTRSVHVFRFADGKVSQHWIFGNGLAIPTQLGLIAPPPAP